MSLPNTHTMMRSRDRYLGRSEFTDNLASFNRRRGLIDATINALRDKSERSIAQAKLRTANVMTAEVVKMSVWVA